MNDHQQRIEGLRTSLGRDDSAVDRAIMPVDCRHALVVAGSGARVLSALARRPRRLTCVDVSREQLWLTEARLALARTLEPAAYRSFWGYPGPVMQPTERQRVFDSIALSDGARDYLTRAFAASAWDSLLYSGRWERALQRASWWNARLTGARGRGLLDCQSMEEQRAYLAERFPRWTWSATLLAARRGVSPGDAFNRLFDQTPARTSFLAQQFFHGRLVSPEGCPDECDDAVYRAAREALNSTDIVYARGDPLEVAGGCSIALDFVSLADLERETKRPAGMPFLRRLAPGMARGGIVVWRGSQADVVGESTAASEGFRRVTAAWDDVRVADRAPLDSVEVYCRD